MKMKKAQALLFVLFVLAVFGVLSGALTVMWQTELQMRSSEREGLLAFYLAQAAVERAKIMVLYGYWVPNTYTINNQNDLDVAGDNYQFLYDITIITPAGTTRTITGTGRVLDLAGNQIARREIQVVVTGISDTVPLGGDGQDDDLSGAVQNWSWQEI